MWLFSLEDTWNIAIKKMAAESGIGCGIRDQLRKPCISCGIAALEPKI